MGGKIQLIARVFNIEGICRAEIFRQVRGDFAFKYLGGISSDFASVLRVNVPSGLICCLIIDRAHRIMTDHKETTLRCSVNIYLLGFSRLCNCDRLVGVD